MENTAAKLCGVSYIYSEKTPFEKVAVDGVDVTLEEGMVTGLIGHTGSGKSTVAQMLNGLLRPTSGEVYVLGRNIWENPKDIRRVRFEAGLVFQYPEYQLFEETVARDIAFGPRNMGLPEEEISSRVAEAMAFVGLDASLSEKSPFDLSGGQKRRVALAGVMAMQPKILILDEPAAGLDPRGRDEILSGVVRYKERTGATVVMISHSMEDMARYCDRILVMNDGKPYLYGTPEVVFSEAERLEKVGLSVPQITRLMAELRRRGYPVSASVYTVEAALAEIRKLTGGDRA
ncbi:MAG: energy-coupling factor transporter ATPase [Ruminococcus sp.]|nr:energy-coupling factor transporter ATPase [Candidatus Apopatosoma intestinale]